MATHYNKTKILFQNQTTNAISDYFDLQRAYDSTQAQRLMHYTLQVVGNLGGVVGNLEGVVGNLEGAVLKLEMLDFLKDEGYTSMDNKIILNPNFATDVVNNANWYESGDDPLTVGVFPNLGWRPGKYRIKITGAVVGTNVSVYLIEDKG